MQVTEGIYSILNKSGVYSLLMSLITSKNTGNIIVNNYIKPFPNCNVLDLGCGPADILASYPDKVNYYGVDLSEDYIEAAKAKYTNGGGYRQFICSSVVDLESLGLPEFDIVTLIGVLHHLTDDEASQTLNVASKMLKKNGRLITLDNCWLPRQNIISKFLISRDRGKNVRTPEEYEALVKPWFKVKSTHTNLNRIPYDHWIMEGELIQV